MFRSVSNLIGFSLLVSLCGIAQAADFSAWSRVEQPSPHTPEAIGSYSSGCLSGAVRLPLVGNGYQVVRPKRNRYYGHPDLIYFLQSLGHRAAQSGARILIGDLSQPRGGPMGYSHRSHQSGLDADVWFRHIPLGRELTWQQSNNATSASTVNGKTIDGVKSSNI